MVHISRLHHGSSESRKTSRNGLYCSCCTLELLRYHIPFALFDLLKVKQYRLSILRLKGLIRGAEKEKVCPIKQQGSYSI
jgi:hypothetical protein